MKTKIPVSLILFFVILFISGFKNEISHVSVKFNIPSKQLTSDKAKILATHKWKVQETIQNLSCQNVHYIRDKINTTGYDQGILRLTFNENGTGTYIDCKGEFYKIKWEFFGDNETNMRIKVMGLLEHEWNMVVITDEYLMETAKIEGIGMVTAKWVPENNCQELVSNK